jgi:prevent-host-death family protein
MGEPELVGVRELRQNLSKYLRRVAQGETLRVGDGGHPVAVLAPLPAEASPVDRLAAEGRLTRARLNLTALGPPPEAGAAMTLSEALEQERREG